MTKHNFEVFGGKNRFVVGARVTLTNRGYFVFNSAAMEMLGNPDALVYLYDRETEAVAFAPTTRDTRHAFRVSHTGRSSAGQSHAARFCKYYGIKHEQSAKCVASMEEGRLVIELRGAVPVTPRPRRPKATAPPPSGAYTTTGRKDDGR